MHNQPWKAHTKSTLRLGCDSPCIIRGCGNRHVPGNLCKSDARAKRIPFKVRTCMPVAGQVKVFVCFFLFSVSFTDVLVCLSFPSLHEPRNT